jgi:hypothetical protein
MPPGISSHSTISGGGPGGGGAVSVDAVNSFTSLDDPGIPVAAVGVADAKDWARTLSSLVLLCVRLVCFSLFGHGEDAL